MILSKNETNLIKVIRKTGYGQMTIKIENSEPQRVLLIEKSIHLGELLDSNFEIGRIRVED